MVNRDIGLEYAGIHLGSAGNRLQCPEWQHAGYGRRGTLKVSVAATYTNARKIIHREINRFGVARLFVKICEER